MKIFVTYSNTPNCIECGNTPHQKFLEKPNTFIPILGGKQLYKGNNQFFKNMKGDDTGNSISYLNPYINEHTVIYWVYEHLNEINDDYIGFCHYRRLFDVPENETLNKNTIFINPLGLSTSMSTQFLMNHDPHVIRTFGEFIRKFMNNDNIQFLARFLESKILFSANMFIMHKDRFKQYMQIIYPIYKILFDMIFPFPNVSDRACGFILERMTSYAILTMASLDTSISIKQGKYEKLEEGMIT